MGRSRVSVSVAALALSCVIGLQFLQIKGLGQISLANYHTDVSSSTSGVDSTRRRKVGDGCYHVFLDVGSNIGIHARFLYEPDRYPESKSSVPAFAREFGYPRDNRDCCVFSFEPNPKFEQRHLDLEKAYKAMGWRYTPILAGASNIDGNMTFYHSAFEKEAWENGFSAVTPKTLYGANATKKTVKIIRLASWIRDEIEGREIPTNQHSELHSNRPKVVMKLDIEGLEFSVFPDLLLTGALCNNISFLMGEFHYGPGNWNYYPIKLTSDAKHKLHHRKEGEQLAQQILHLVDITENCMTRISLDDDESYLTDPHELPSPNATSSAS
ncbi:hypothetical protein ACHAWF_004013 [Thalassiosira exigua]